MPSSRYTKHIGAGEGITATIRSDVSRIIDKIDAAGGNLPEAVRVSVLGTLGRMVAEMRTRKLSGRPYPVSSKGPIPRGTQYLGVRTARGRSSIKYDARKEQDRVIGEFGPTHGPVPDPGVYMRVHEEGFTGTVKVRPHTRRVGGKTVPVRAHDRLMDLPVDTSGLSSSNRSPNSSVTCSSR